MEPNSFKGKPATDGFKIEVPSVLMSSHEEEGVEPSIHPEHQSEFDDASKDHSNPAPHFSQPNVANQSDSHAQPQGGTRHGNHVTVNPNSNKSRETDNMDATRPRTKQKARNLRAVEEEADLGIYEDTAECDDLSDIEMELAKQAKQNKNKSNDTKKHMKEVEKVVEKGIVDSFQRNVQIKADAPISRPDTQVTMATGLDERMTTKSMSASKFSQEAGVRELYRKSGYRAKASTPISAITDISDGNASRLALESREAMFRRAMTLLSARCTSVHQGLESSLTTLSRDQGFGQYIYIPQEKPLPMPPLKAWKGYNGNVYFEPINIAPVKTPKGGGEDDVGAVSQGNERLQKMLAAKKGAMAEQKEMAVAVVDSRSNSQLTNKSSQGSSNVRPGTRQMVLLDKQAVLNRFNENIQEDIIWLDGQENTGSLAIKPRHKEKVPAANSKEKICKGSVAHKLYLENKTRSRPKLAVSGGKFIPPTSLSPLLRAQTQYSLSSHRLTTNSPDPYHLHQESKLPPLEQLRASIKHEQSLPRSKTYNRPFTLTSELKPFVKYSPDVVAKFNQQAHIC